MIEDHKDAVYHMVVISNFNLTPDQLWNWKVKDFMGVWAASNQARSGKPKKKIYSYSKKMLENVRKNYERGCD